MPFTERHGAVVICIVCRLPVDHLGAGHDGDCPIVALDAQVKEMASHVGVFVSNMRETLNMIGKILRDQVD